MLFWCSFKVGKQTNLPCETNLLSKLLDDRRQFSSDLLCSWETYLTYRVSVMCLVTMATLSDYSPYLLLLSIYFDDSLCLLILFLIMTTDYILQLSIHSAYSLYLLNLTIYSAYSLCLFTLPNHSTYSLCLLIPPIHSAYSLTYTHTNLEI